MAEKDSKEKDEGDGKGKGGEEPPVDFAQRWQAALLAGDDREEVVRLFANLKAALPELVVMLDGCDEHWASEDLVYRFYHQSFKVYRIQDLTNQIVGALQALAPDRPLNAWFMQIIKAGTGIVFKREDNQHWLEVTRPMIEAFFHAHYFLQMAVKYGRELERPPRMLPSGWASVLYLYDLR